MVRADTIVFRWLTLYRQDMSKLINAKPCVVVGSRVSTFSCSTLYTCVCGLLCPMYRIEVINSFKQDVWSQFTNTLTLPDPIFLESHDFNKATTVWVTLHIFFHNFRQLQSWLCIGGLWKTTIFCVSYVRTHAPRSLIIVNQNVGKWQWCPYKYFK
jgi:hypothetical protein